MAAQPELPTAARVGLLGRDDAVRGQLRAALSEAGAAIVFEGELAAASVALLRDSGLGTLIVNLEPGTEDGLDRIDELLDDPAVQVVFNESETTRSLSGWDLARWARHLVAKVLGHGDVTPPAPPGAEALPLRDLQPQPRIPIASEPSPAVEQFASIADEAMVVSADVPQAVLPQADTLVVEPLRPPEAPEPEVEIHIDIEREPADADIDIELPSIAIERPTSEAAEGDYGLDLEAIEIGFEPGNALEDAVQMPRRLGPDEPTVVLSRSELHEQLAVDEADLELPQPGRRLAADEPTTVLDIADIEAGLAALDVSVSELDVAPASDAYIEASDDAALLDKELEGLLALGDTDLAALPKDEEPSYDLAADDDVAALAAQLDALAEQMPAAVSNDAGLDFDFAGTGPRVSEAAAALDFDRDFGEADVPLSSDDDSTKVGVGPSKSAVKGFGELSLLSEDEEAEVLAPPPKAEAPSYDFSNIDLTLEPLEGEGDEALAEDVAAATGASPVPAIKGIPRVIVLGASIGGPDALRTFLAAVPAGFPALFVLVQHLENGFFARLAQQLQKACALNVRVADDGAGPASVGDVLVLPSNLRFSIDRDGVISHEDYAEPPRYKPCIDDAFRAAADVFGADTLAIIFSGMAGDAVEGASYVTANGGEVWAQDPQSCVVSSMIDGARARGVVEFIGSPRELAERCVARFGQR